MLKKIPIRRKLFQCTLMLLILLYLLELADLPLQARPDSRLTAGEHRYTAVVRQIREKEDAVCTLRVRLCSMDDAPLDGAREALLTYYQKIEQPWLLQKSKLRFTCSLRLPQSAGNPHCFDYADYLKSCGVRCLRHIPRRIEEGYGLSKEAIQGLRDQGATLMITVDCGITGNEEVDFAASIGLDVVITDHHECKEELPRALAVVDPHRSDCPYPFKHLAGVGVALKLVLALGGESREDALCARYCTLAAIGTIADVMRMEGENRTIAFCGLEALPHTDFVGVHALLKEAGLLGKPITSVQIGFVLAPRINAAGRMGAADLAADLLETDDPARAEELAKALCDLNRERQAVEQAICADATE